MNADTPAPYGWKRSAKLGLSFRPLTDDDLMFVGLVYASSLKQELVGLPWSDAQKAAFLLLQFRAQQNYYQHEYPDGEWLVIAARDETDIGRLYLERGEEETHIIDIALLPQYRGKGIGGAVLRDLMDEAARAGVTVFGDVQKDCRAMHLYKRLGFKAEKDKGDYDLMRWRG